MGRKETIRKEIFLNELPKWRSGTNKEKINWEQSVGHKVKFRYIGIEGEVTILSYEGKYLYIKYQNEEPFKIITSKFRDCAFGRLLGIITGNFKIKIGTNFKDKKRDLTIIDRKIIKNKRDQNVKYYKYKCNKCGFDCGEHYKNGEYREELWVKESTFKNAGCSCCRDSPQITVYGINSIEDTSPWMIKYFSNLEDTHKYTKCSHQSILTKCPYCGAEKEMKIEIIYALNSVSCTCGDGKSYPEKFLINLLEQLSKIYKFDNLEYEYSPKWIKPKRYDSYFKLKNKKYIIEMDGKLGHGNEIHSRDTKTIEDTIEIDNYKDKLAKEHNVKMIRIDAKESKLEYIKNNIINSDLSKMFDLTNIDWNKCEEFALNNMVKIICEMKRDNPNMTTVNISEIMKLHPCTVNRYLNRGAKIGWCVYNPKEEMVKVAFEMGKLNGKQVEIFNKDGISLGIFPSCSELARQSKELFGIKLLQTGISEVCNGKNKTHHGYIFKYVDLHN